MQLAKQTAEFAMVCYSSWYLLIQVSFRPVPFITNFVMNLDVNLIKSFFYCSFLQHTKCVKLPWYLSVMSSSFTEIGDVLPSDTTGQFFEFVNVQEFPACNTDETKPLAKSVCRTGPKSLFLATTQCTSTMIGLLKKPLIYWSIRKL